MKYKLRPSDVIKNHLDLHRVLLLTPSYILNCLALDGYVVYAGWPKSKCEIFRTGQVMWSFPQVFAPMNRITRCAYMTRNDTN